jgi:hypothetical protein
MTSKSDIAKSGNKKSKVTGQSYRDKLKKEVAKRAAKKKVKK